MRQLLLGLDIGTTLTKGVLIDLEGAIVAEAARESTLISRNPMWAEEDPELWWANVVAIVPELLARAGAGAGDVSAIGVSGMVPAMVLLDAAGRLLRPSIQQNDARTAREIAELKAAHDERRFFELTGGSINQQVVAPKALWLWKHEPEVMTKLSTLFGSYDYVAFRLTGQRSAERNWALESGLYDVRKERFSQELLELARLRPEQLADVHASHEIIGEVTAAAAAATGLAAGTAVVAGVADHVSSAYATTAYGDGDLVLKLGGAGDILFSMGRLVTDPRLYIDYHVVPGKYYLNGCMATSGSLLEWYVHQFCDADAAQARAEGRSSYALLDERAGATTPGADGLVLLPYFLGEKTPLFDAAARGTLIGLDLHHTRHHVYRAVLESVAYGFRHHVDVLGERGLTIARVLAADGGARSDLWLQICADVLGRPVRRVAGHPGSGLGAAIAAGMGCGLLDGWSDIERYVRLDRTFLPDERAHARYDELYGVYRESYERLKPLYPQLAS